MLPKPKINSKPITLPTDFPIQFFPTLSSLETFYSQHSSSIPGFHLKLAKKSSLIPSVTQSQAVEAALCYGWIDGVAHPFDDSYWLTRYTPRRAKSIWSAKNVGTVERLVAEGRMKEEGLKRVEEAKADGRWEKAYQGQRRMEVPDDLVMVLRETGNEKARKLWEGMGRGERYPILLRLHNIADKNRVKKLEEVLKILAAHAAGSAKSKSEIEKVAVRAKPTGVIKSQKATKAPQTSTTAIKVSKTATKKTEDRSGNGRRPGLRSGTKSVT